MRGRLFFYAHWMQEARAYLAFLARRQYAEDDHPSATSIGIAKWPLTHQLLSAICFFLELLDSPMFLNGICPESLVNKPYAVIYTDGSLTALERGIGGLCVFPGTSVTPEYFAEELEDGIFYPHIAVVEMRAVLFAFRYFSRTIRGHAITFFIDNTHALGCLLRRSSPLHAESAVERRKSTVINSAHAHLHFEQLSEDIKYSMNELARQIWSLITELDVLVWFEYVNTKLNMADPPSRGFIPPCGGTRVGDTQWEMRPFSDFVKEAAIAEAVMSTPSPVT